MKRQTLNEILSAARALVFDLDGTLVDTMPAHFRAWTKVVNEFGLSLTRERFYQLGGVPTWQTLEILSVECGKEIDIAAAAEMKKSLQQEILAEAETIEPIVNIAQSFYRKIPIGLATGSNRVHANSILQKVGIEHLFDSVKTSDDVNRYKPEPDVFLAAAEALGVEPNGCVAFEDTDIGLQAIRRAGMTPVDVRDLL